MGIREKVGEVVTSRPRLLFDKIWDAHCVATLGGGYDLIYVDRHMLHELASDIAFAQLQSAGHHVRRPDLCFATQDHVVSTAADRNDDSLAHSAAYIRALRENTRQHHITLFDLGDRRQGIVHVVAPELAIALPGLTMVCGDSHTCTVGALGALAWGIGTSEVAHVLATQTLMQRRPQVLRIDCRGVMPRGVTAKDIILALIGQLGANAGDGFALEYGGEAVAAMTIEERLTLCNLSIEMGARMGQVAPDDTTFEYLSGRAYAPSGQQWDDALASWRALPGDAGAEAAREATIDVSMLEPQVTWGTSPAHVAAISGRVPDPHAVPAGATRSGMQKALDYMGLTAGTALSAITIDNVFIGSCTNSRISDLRAAAAILTGRQVADGVRALVVPGSMAVKAQAEAEGLDAIFLAAGFEWRQPGCSMCVAVNDDRVAAGQRCVSTSNRNFEGRQGPGSRTHLASPATAAATAVTGHLSDPRRFLS